MKLTKGEKDYEGRKRINNDKKQEKRMQQQNKKAIIKKSIRS